MTLHGTNQGSGRPHNRRIIFELIRRHGPVSRADIARNVGLSIQTVSNITKELEDSGFLVATRERTNRRGHPPSILEIRAEGGLAIGLQITPQELRAALIDLSGNVLGQKSRGLRSVRPSLVFAKISRLVEELRVLRPGGRFLGIGVAMPGPFDVESMSFVGPTTIEGWKGVPVARRIEATTGLPVFVGGDAACATTTENMFGVGRQTANFYHIYFGIGLGGGVVVDNNLVRGAFGNAGELGHLPVGPAEEICPCGNRGCLERVLSLDALLRRLRRAGLLESREGLLSAIESNHAEVRAWIDDVSPLLAKAVVIVENLLDPAVVVVGGLLPTDVRRRLVAAANPLPPSVSDVSGRTLERLVCSDFGPDVALIGAGLLAIANVLSPRASLAYPHLHGTVAAEDPMVTETAGAPTAVRTSA